MVHGTALTASAGFTLPPTTMEVFFLKIFSFHYVSYILNLLQTHFNGLSIEEVLSYINKHNEGKQVIFFI